MAPHDTKSEKRIREECIEFSEIQRKKLRLSEIQKIYDMPWESISFPLNPENSLQNTKLYAPGRAKEFWKEFGNLLGSGMQDYPNDLEEAASPEPGKYFDLVSLLGGDLIRNNGDRVALHRDSFKGKHVLVCCFLVPVIVSSFWINPWKLQSIINLCKELYSTRRDEFEIVVVARMNSLTDDEGVFNHFFSGFPEFCLAVPFKNSHRRDYIWKLLRHSTLFYDSDSVFGHLYLDAEGKVCPRLKIFTYYGGEAFPFTEKAIRKADEECRKVIFEKANNLEAVLRCNDSSPDYVYKFGSGTRVPISQLMMSKNDDKHVGLLLCCKGNLIPKLCEMYEQCREDGKVFEIVVVYLPFDFERLPDPDIFKEEMDDVLRKHSTCRSWWCLPFNNSVSRRLWRITKKYGCDEIEDYVVRDKLMVVGPGVERLDMYGDRVMRGWGISGYPFTYEAVIADKMKDVRELTLESLLPSSLKRGNVSDMEVSVGELKAAASKVFLCITGGGRYCDLKTLVPVYHELKKRFGYEVVSVEFGTALGFSEFCKSSMSKQQRASHFRQLQQQLMANVQYKQQQQQQMASQMSKMPMMGRCNMQDEERLQQEKMPWYVCPTINESMMELRRLLVIRNCAIVGFGDDGRVCSVKQISAICSVKQISAICSGFSPQDFRSGDTLRDDFLDYSGFRTENEAEHYNVAASLGR